MEVRSEVRWLAVWRALSAYQLSGQVPTGDWVLARQGREHTIRNSWRQNVRPLVDRLNGHADGTCGRHPCPPEEIDCFCLVHAALKHPLRQDASMLRHEQSKLAPVEDFKHRLKRALDLAQLGPESEGRKALARHLSISTAAVGQALNGQTKFTAENSVRAARFLRVDPYWFATGEGDPRPSVESSGQERTTGEPSSKASLSEAEAQMGEVRLSIARLAAAFASADEVTRESVAPLLSKVATEPQQFDRLAKMIEALLAASATTKQANG